MKPTIVQGTRINRAGLLRKVVVFTVGVMGSQWIETAHTATALTQAVRTRADCQPGENPDYHPFDPTDCSSSSSGTPRTISLPKVGIGDFAQFERVGIIAILVGIGAFVLSRFRRK